MVEESDDNDEVITKEQWEGGAVISLTIYLGRMMKWRLEALMTIRNAFYFAARINLHTFLVEQVASVL